MQRFAMDKMKWKKLLYWQTQMVNNWPNMSLIVK